MTEQITAEFDDVDGARRTLFLREEEVPITGCDKVKASILRELANKRPRDTTQDIRP